MNVTKNKSTKPLSFENKTFAVVFFVVIFLEIFFLGNLFNYFGFNPATIIIGQLVDNVNTNRSQVGLNVLSENELLIKAAQMKADDMAQKSYFSHTTPENRKFTYFLDFAGYDFKYAGENLAVTQQDTIDVAEAWMKSPTHKANILRSKYNDIGMAMATGTYKGNEVVFIAQYFGTKNNIEKINNTGAVLGAFMKDDSNQKIDSGTMVLGVQEDQVKNNNILNFVNKKFANVYTIKILWVLSLLFVSLSLLGFLLKFKYRTLFVNTFFLLTVITLFLIADWYILFKNNIKPDFIDEIKFTEVMR